jgi:hypothetical protein
MAFFNEEFSASSPLPVKEILIKKIRAPFIYFRDIARASYPLAIFVIAITFVERLLASNSSLSVLP